MSGEDDRIERVQKAIGTYPDFPKKGILFRDVFGVTRRPEALVALHSLLKDRVRRLDPQPDVIVALDARGFLFGPLLALDFNIPFVPVRKRGKLPGRVHQVSYKLEYGEDVFEIQEGSVKQGQKVLIVDDLIATGGSMAATCQLVSELQARVVSCLVVIELVDLKGRDKLNVPLEAILQY